MVKLFRALAPAVFLLATASVMAQDVRYNYDENADFSKYKTYKWEQHPDSAQIDELTLKQLGQAFDEELAKKGLTRKNEGNTDLVIVYEIAVREEKQVTAYNSGWSAGPYWGPGWYGATGGGFSTVTTSTIPIGAISLDIYDAGTKTLVWRGQATKTIDTNAKPEKQRKNMAKAAKKLLKNFPPKKKK